MDDPSQTDRATAPVAPDKDYAQVLDMLNSVEMQKRLEEARSKRARVLAERAAGTAGPTAVNLVPAAVPRSIDAAGTKPFGTATPTPAALPDEAVATMVEPPETAAAPGNANPAGTADAVATLVVSPLAEAPPAAPPPVESPRRTVPVLRAPPRPALSGPAGVSRSGPLPVERRNIQPRSVALGLLVGMLAGVGVTQVMDVTAPSPSAPAERAPETGDPPSINVDAVSLIAGPADTATAAPSRLVVPRPRPALRGDAALADRLAPRPTAPAQPPQIRIDEVLRSSRTQSPPVAASGPEALSAAPLPAPRAAVERTVFPIKDVATPLRAEPPAATPAPLGQRLRMVLHRPPDFPEGALADLRTTLREAGFELPETRTVRLRFTRNEVRYFHKEDAANAARIAKTIGAEPRDFSTYRPSPSLGTVEVWLAARR